MIAHVEPGGLSQAVLDRERLLIERARRNPEAFGEVYSLYYDRIYAYVNGRVGCRETAEDIAADVFVLALQHLPRYEWRNVPFGAWLFRIAASQVAGYYRRSRPSAQLHELMLDACVDPEEEALRHSAAGDVRDALATLGVDQRRAMELRYLRDMRASEIAREMGRTEASVKLLLHRGLASLRVRMLPLSA